MPTPSQARNAIKRCLTEVVDPNPTRSQINRLWKYFDSCCCYCGKRLERSKRNGHKDHLVPSAVGGENCLSNRVLSCGPCNGDQKLDADWKEFIASKCSGKLLRARRRKIEDWVEENGGAGELSEEKQRQAAAMFDRVNLVLTECVDELRSDK